MSVGFAKWDRLSDCASQNTGWKPKPLIFTPIPSIAKVRKMPKHKNPFVSVGCSRRQAIQLLVGAAVGGTCIPTGSVRAALEHKPLGHWPLIEDARDRSGNGHHGVPHGSTSASGSVKPNGLFDGRSDYVEIPRSEALMLRTSNFTIAAWVKAGEAATDVIGDVISKWDPATRTGFTLCIKGSSGGYNSHGSQRGVQFGIDQASTGTWNDCGRPNATSSYVSNSLTVFNGELYAATSDAHTENAWRRVYRYAGGQDWIDCGQVGDRKARGVGPMVVHDSSLYAATWNYDWTRVAKDDVDLSRVYRYVGGSEWEDCGQPGNCKRLFGIASYKGRLYVVGDDLGCWTYNGDRHWTLSRKFRSLVHPMAIHNGKLYVGEFGDRVNGVFRKAEVFTFDGQSWSSAGQPMAPDDREDQIHALHTYQSQLHATTWPKGKVWALGPDGQWATRGRLGESTESNALHVYNGTLYAGTIPRGEVYRFDGETNWTLLRRFCPDDAADPKHWGRVTSLTSFGGRLYASLGSYTSSILDAPPDLRGRVFSYEAGKSVAHDRDIGSKWRHMTAVRRDRRLELYIDGDLSSMSSASSTVYDLSNEAPLRIGLGPTEHFFGNIRDVRLYGEALDASAVRQLALERPT